MVMGLQRAYVVGELATADWLLKAGDLKSEVQTLK
jgi:hypothetical protein